MFESKVNRGKANGYAPLGSDGKVSTTYLPPIQAAFDSSSFATTGSNTFVGNQTISGGIQLTGNITGGLGAINFVPSSSGDGYGYSTIEIRPDSTTTNDQYLIIDPTSPNHIHIRAGGTQDNSAGQLIIGGENTYFKVSDGANPYIYVLSSNNITLDANNDVNITSGNGDIILNADGNIYKGSAGAGNALLTGGYLDSVIGDTNIVNNGTGHTITDNLNNIINSISGFATTGSNIFIGSQTISGSLILSSSAPQNLTGSLGDKAGTIAFDNNYLYYCTSSFIPPTFSVTGRGEGTHIIIPNGPNVPNIQSNGYTVTTATNQTFTITGAYPGAEYWYCEIDNLNNSYYSGNETMLLTNLNYVAIDIWKQIPFGSGSINTSNLVTTSSFNSYTSSNEANITTLFTASASLNSSVSTLTAATSSYVRNSQTSSMSVALATTASYWSGSITNATSASYAITASYALNGGSGNIDTSSLVTTSSFNSYTASNAMNIVSLFATSASLNSSVNSLTAATSSYVRNSQTSSMSVALAASATSASFALTASFASNFPTINTGSLLLTSSFNAYTSSLNAFSASILSYTSSINAKTGSFATTGSNTFVGNQTITGSLSVTSAVSVISSAVVTTGSLTLNSGSNFFLQNNGIAQITGSLLVSGSTQLTGSLSIQSGSITMPNRPAFRVIGTGGAKAAVTPLTGSYLVVDYQQGSGWDNSTGTFTAPIAGLYQVNVVVRTNSNSLGTISQLIVYKNNTTGVTGTPQVMVEFGANTTMNHAGGSTISRLAVGDTLKMVVASGEISFDSNDNFSVAYIG